MDITESPGYRDYIWAVGLHRVGLEVIGLWPKSHKFAKRSLWSELHSGILILVIFICNVPIIYAIMQVQADMILVIKNLQMAVPLIMALVKYIIMRWKRTVLLSIINMMAEDWMAFKFDSERDVMISRAQTARVVMIIGYLFLLIGNLLMIVPTYFGIQVTYLTNFTNRDKPMLLETYYFYDADESPQFELTFFFQVITIISGSMVYMCIDIFLTLIILHICGQLENFRYRLMNLISCKNFDKALNYIIIRHLRLIRFVDNLENVYSVMLLILVFQFCILFCLSGFVFTIVLIDRKLSGTTMAQAFFSILIIIVALMNTFLYCGAGELITEQSDAVHRAICDLKWYKLKSKKARNLILLMIRASHPFHITAGKIFPLTMATFCNVLKTSCGYISFLLTKRS